MSESCGSPRFSSGHEGGLVWFLGAIGAAIHFLSQSEGFWSGVLAILKALAWPVFLVWKLLQHVQA